MEWVIVLLLLAALASLTVLFAPACCRKKHPLVKKLQGVPFAHRGLHDEKTPENSLAAIKRAVNEGYGIEFDLHLTLDGQLAVMHDDSLARTCGVDLKVCECPLAELTRHPLSNGEPLPTLPLVLEAVKGRVPLLIELKHDGSNADALVAATVKVLEGYEGDYILESFDPRILLALKKQAPQMARGQLSCNFMKMKGQPLYLRIPLYLMILNLFTRPDFIAYRLEDERSLPLRIAKRAGVPLFFWTVKDKTSAKTALERGHGVIFEGFTF